MLLEFFGAKLRTIWLGTRQNRFFSGRLDWKIKEIDRRLHPKSIKRKKDALKRTVGLEFSSFYLSKIFKYMSRVLRGKFEAINERRN